MSRRFVPRVTQAERFNIKASIQIEGISGTGKSGAALMIAHGLVNDWSKIGAVDTEERSLNLYTGATLSTGEVVGTIQKVDLSSDDGFAPDHYIASKEALKASGAEVVIFDSTTHAWTRTGGVLEMVSDKESKSKNKFSAWGDPDVVRNKNLIYEMLRDSETHIISTVRVKKKHVLEFDEKTNKNKVVSLGDQQITQEGVEYEPDLGLTMLTPGSATAHPTVRVFKSRYPMFEKDVEYTLTPELIEHLRQYLNEGKPVTDILKEQKESLIQEVMANVGTDKNKRALYDAHKRALGFADIAIENMTVAQIKQLLERLTK